MLHAVERAGVKHAYAPTSRYGPLIVYGRELLSSGIIGQIREIETVTHFDCTTWPYNWVHDLGQGGGFLNNLFTHKLAQVLRLTDGEAVAAMGDARRLIERAPIGPPLHDFRYLFQATADNLSDATEWREIDADFGYTVLLQLRLPGGQIASAMFQGSGASTHLPPEYTALFGTTGTLHLTDRIQHYDKTRKEWRDMPVPQAIIDSLPQIQDSVQRDWNQLFREFVADVRGDGYAGYPTFRDGWVAAEIMEIVRSGKNWTPLPEHPA
jgi:predicted dehydrogenase